MSNRYITAAMEMQVGNPTKKLILIKLADNANDDGICWPSYGTIARHCGVDKRTVMRHIKQLEEMGVLAKKHRMTTHGNSSNVYQIYIPAPALTRGDNKSLGGDINDTRGVTVGSPRGCHPCHPEPSIEPSIEPSLKTTPAKADFSAFDNAVTQWNEFANEVGLPKVSKITTPRARKIDTAYKNYKKLRTELNDGNPEPKRMLEKAEFVEALIMVARKQITDFHINMPITFDYLLDKKRVDTITETGVFK